MGAQADRCELARNALANARRVAERLHRHERDLARKIPGETRGGEVLRNAASAGERLARLLEASRPAAAPSHPDP